MQKYWLATNFHTHQLSVHNIDSGRQNATNQLHYRHNQGPRDIGESFAQYISDFTDDVKMPLENHPFVQAQQQQFRNEIAKF